MKKKKKKEEKKSNRYTSNNYEDKNKIKSLEIRESPDNGVFVANAYKGYVLNDQEVLQLMNEGELNRHYGQTKMNDLSSRSHTILSLEIQSKANNSNKVKKSTLHFVDLAGSERIAQAGTEGKRAKEGMYINKSLLNLGIVIDHLSKGRKHIPYRDSKLTRMLSSSLGGNSRTAIICTVSPALSNLEHSINTLRFGSRAIKIQNHHKVNEITNKKTIEEFNNKVITVNKNMLKELHEKHKQMQYAKKQAKAKIDYIEKSKHLENLILNQATSYSAIDNVTSQKKEKKDHYQLVQFIHI